MGELIREVCPIYSSKLVNTINSLNIPDQEVKQKAELLAYVFGELFWPPPDILLFDDHLIFRFSARNVELDFVVTKSAYRFNIKYNN